MWSLSEIMRIENTGEYTAALLLISALSGFVLAYQYEVASPFVSTTAIETVLPFGAFWRSVHFWSSQAFFILLLCHVWQSTASLQRFCRSARGRLHWAVVSLTIPLSLYALFSGYVLRNDGTGRAAGTIAEHLFLNVPIGGQLMDRLLMAAGSEGLNRVYVVHILFTLLCWGIGTWYHTRRVIMGKAVFGLALFMVVATGWLLSAPIDLPGQNLHLIKGPWFFLGIQELLRYASPLLAGIIFPVVPLVMVALLPWLHEKRWSWWGLGAWSFVYVLATMVAVSR